MMLESSSGSSTLPPFSSLPPTLPLPQPVQISRASRFRNSVTNRMSTTTGKLNSSSNGLHLRREIDNTSSNSGQQQNRISNVSPVAKVPNLHCLSKRNLIAHELFFSLFQSLESYHLSSTERISAKSISSSPPSSSTSSPSSHSLPNPASNLPPSGLSAKNDFQRGRTTPSAMASNSLPSTSRRSMNPFRKEATGVGAGGGSGGGRLLKRVSRAVSGGSTGVEGDNQSISSQLSPKPVLSPSPSPSSSPSPSPSPESSLSPPVSPIWSSPPLSPTCSFRSNSSTSSRSIRRKPVHYGNLALDSPSTSSSSTCGSDDDLIEYSEDWRGRRGSSTSTRSIEVVDGLWTSTADQRLDEPLPSWFMPQSPKFDSSYSSSRRFTPSLPFHPFSSKSDNFVRIDILPTSPNPSTYSPSLSTSNGFTSPPPIPKVSPAHPPDRKSLLRIESGGRQLILQAGGVGVSIQGDDDSDDDEEILVISLPPC